MNWPLRIWIWTIWEIVRSFLETLADYRQRFRQRASQLGLLLAPEYEHKAERLLIRNLTPEQNEQYKKDKCFSVTGSETGAIYLITQGRTMNVWRLDEKGQCIEQLCFHPVEYLPMGDDMLAQKLMLEACEKEVLSMANKYRPIRKNTGFLLFL